MNDNCQDSAEMPRYKCHKEVWALKIKSLDPSSGDSITGPDEETDGGLIMTPEEVGYAQVKLDAEYVRKHCPEVGGYYVVYKGGYKSYSPAEPFESGYTLVN